MAIQIPLRHKYTLHYRGRYKGGEKPAPPKKRNKIGRIKHVAKYGEPPKAVRVVDGGTGKSRMVIS